MSVEELISSYGIYSSKRRAFLTDIGCDESNRDPLAEFCERLVTGLIGGSVAKNRVQKDYDVEAPGMKIQVKYLANPKAKDINGHAIVFPKEATHYAIVYFEDLDLHSVLLLEKPSLGPAYDVLKKRHKGRGEILLLQRANILSIVSNPVAFKKIGIVVMYSAKAAIT